MKRVKLNRTIEGFGCVLIRHGAKHDWYRNANTGVSQPVPRHREIKDHLARHIIADTECAVLIASRTSRGMSHSCKVSLGDDLFASMTGSFWKRQGQVVTPPFEFQVDASAMRDGDNQLATYSISERFMRLTLVKLVDCASRRTFLLRQKRIWSGHLVMLENDALVADYVPNLFHSKYRITATKETPQPVVLLSTWLATIHGVFGA